MQEHYKEEIDELKSNLMRMAGLVDQQIEKAMKSLQEKDLELAQSIKAKDLEIDAYDNLIQAQYESLLAIFQPVASDLRFIIAIIMINNNLERCGDIAVNIANRVRKIGEKHHLIVESKVSEMALIARQMVKYSIDSFVNNDEEMAQKVLETDDRVDEFNRNAFKFAVARMKEDSSSIEASSHLIVLARQIERLADHATNIAESLIFYKEGKIITHQKKLGKEGKGE